MQLTCTKCNTIISAYNVNVSTDLAKCDNCDSIYRASALIDNLSIEEINNPPIGAKMNIKRVHDDSIEIFYPKKGLTFSVIPQLFFTLIWNGFVSVWTWGVSQGDSLFALFSIPFWLMGVAMLISLINSIFEEQTIKLNNSKLQLKKNRPIRAKNIEIQIKDIQSIRMKLFKKSGFSLMSNFNLMLKMQKTMSIGGFEIPAIISNTNAEYFFEDANDGEQEWITHFLNNMIRRMRNKKNANKG